MIVVFGKSGQVATELSKFDSVKCFGRKEINIFDVEAVETLLAQIKPDAVINAAAFTDVDGSESMTSYCNQVNATFPGNLAKICKKLQATFIHLSTDYVFDGLGNNEWKPHDKTNPTCAYGRSKLKGEQNMGDLSTNIFILRTSWVFSAFGNNFVTKMIDLRKKNELLSVVADQIGGPTSARSVALTCYEIIKQSWTNPRNGGIYHLSGKPDVSRAEFAREIFKHTMINTIIKEVKSSDFQTIAKRPLNSRLDCLSLYEDFGLEPCNWKDDLKIIISEIIEDNFGA